MTVKWFLDVNVTNASNSNPLANAMVVINDTNGLNIFNGSTDSTGGIPTQLVTEYTQNGTLAWGNNESCFMVSQTLTTHNLSCFSTYNISVNLTGYDSANVRNDVNRSKFIDITMNLNGTLTACRTLDTANRVYHLANDVTSSATCFTIGANNITLDCHGYEINYSQSSVGYGVTSTNFNATTIRSCNIVQGLPETPVTASYGIFLTTSSFNNITNNTIIVNGTTTFGMRLRSSSINNSVYLNNITANGGSSEGIRLQSSSANNSLYNNTIVCKGFSCKGINAQNTINNYLFYNNITVNNGGASYGILSNVLGANHTIHDNIITVLDSTNSIGIGLTDNSANNTLYRNRITSNAIAVLLNGTGIAFPGVSGNTFTNDTIIPCSSGCASSTYDIIIDGNATDNIFINVSFNKTKVLFVENSSNPIELQNITVKWFLDVNVTDTSNNALASAQVVINDTNGFNVFNSTTDSTGGIPTQTITEFTQNGSVPWGNNDSCRLVLNTFSTENLSCFTTHNISVNITGYVNNNTRVDVNRSKFLNLSLATAVTESCSCPGSGDWVGSFADDCVITSNCNLQGNSLYLSGSGTWTINALIYNFNRIVAHQGNLVCIRQAGCFG